MEVAKVYSLSWNDTEIDRYGFMVTVTVKATKRKQDSDFHI